MLILSYFSLFVPILGFTWLLTSPFFFPLQGKKAKEEKWNHKKREEKSQNEPHSLKKQKKNLLTQLKLLKHIKDKTITILLKSMIKLVI
jgi:hypothetical protein